MDPLAMTLMKRPALQVAGDIVTRRPEMQGHHSPPLRLLNESITPPYVSTVVDNAVLAR